MDWFLLTESSNVFLSSHNPFPSHWHLRTTFYHRAGSSPVVQWLPTLGRSQDSIPYTTKRNSSLSYLKLYGIQFSALKKFKFLLLGPQPQRSWSVCYEESLGLRGRSIGSKTGLSDLILMCRLMNVLKFRTWFASESTHSDPVRRSQVWEVGLQSQNSG